MNAKPEVEIPAPRMEIRRTDVREEVLAHHLVEGGIESNADRALAEIVADRNGHVPPTAVAAVVRARAADRARRTTGAKTDAEIPAAMLPHVRDPLCLGPRDRISPCQLLLSRALSRGDGVLTTALELSGLLTTQLLGASSFLLPRAFRGGRDGVLTSALRCGDRIRIHRGCWSNFPS